MNTKFAVRADAIVKIIINDQNAIKRYTEKEPVPGIGVVDPPYSGLITEDGILEHFAYNAIANGVTQLNKLDGWADLPDDAGFFYVDDVILDTLTK